MVMCGLVSKCDLGGLREDQGMIHEKKRCRALGFKGDANCTL